jgi:hypothetical protein
MPNPSSINIPGVEPGPRTLAASIPYEFAAKATTTPPVRIPNIPFAIFIALSSFQHANPARRPSVSASVRYARRRLS